MDVTDDEFKQATTLKERPTWASAVSNDVVTQANPMYGGGVAHSDDDDDDEDDV